MSKCLNVIVRAAPIKTRDRLDVIDRGETDLTSHPDVTRVGDISAARGNVLHPRIVLEEVGRQTHLQLSREERSGNVALGLNQAVVTGFQIRPCFKRLGRLASDDVDRTAHSVSSIERTLRPAQHLNAIDVYE